MTQVVLVVMSRYVKALLDYHSTHATLPDQTEFLKMMSERDADAHLFSLIDSFDQAVRTYLVGPDPAALPASFSLDWLLQHVAHITSTHPTIAADNLLLLALAAAAMGEVRRAGTPGVSTIPESSRHSTIPEAPTVSNVTDTRQKKDSKPERAVDRPPVTRKTRAPRQGKQKEGTVEAGKTKATAKDKVAEEGLWTADDAKAAAEEEAEVNTKAKAEAEKKLAATPTSTSTARTPAGGPVASTSSAAFPSAGPFPSPSSLASSSPTKVSVSAAAPRPTQRDITAHQQILASASKILVQASASRLASPSPTSLPLASSSAPRAKGSTSAEAPSSAPQAWPSTAPVVIPGPSSSGGYSLRKRSNNEGEPFMEPKKFRR